MGVPLSHPVMDQAAGWCETQALCLGYTEEAPRNHCIVRYQRICICLIMYIPSIELLDRGLYRTDHIFRGSSVWIGATTCRFGGYRSQFWWIDFPINTTYIWRWIPFRPFQKRSPIRIIRAFCRRTDPKK